MFFEIKSILSKTEISLWQKEFQTLSQAHPFQFVDYQDLSSEEERKNLRFFLAWGDPQRSKLCAVALLRFKERPLGFGRVLCLRGPLCQQLSDLDSVLKGLIEKSKQLGCAYLQVSPYWTGCESETATAVMLNLGFRKSLIQGGHTHSVIVNLEQEPEQILKGFNENTRRQIKKAHHFQLDISQPQNSEEVISFHQVYAKMSEDRGASPVTLDYFLRFYAYSQLHSDKATFVLARQNNNVIAGITLLNNPHKSWYIHGASDHSLRDVPLTFLCHWHAMLMLKKHGIKYYDFGGLGDLDSTDSVIIGINRFKKGFSKEDVPKTPEFELILKPAQNYVYQKGTALAKKWLERTL